MTEGAAKKLGTDAVISPVTFEQKQPEINNFVIEIKNKDGEKSGKIDLKDRFARLKKTLRKRSVSIF